MKNFILYKTDVITAVIQSNLTLEISSKKPAKRHTETPFEEKVSDRLHYHN